MVHFLRREPVLTAAVFLAIFSMFFVPPDGAYARYIDDKTLLCLLCLMTSLKGMERTGVLGAVSAVLLARVKSLRGLAFLLVYLCFIASMFMTNDVALIALVPVTLSALSLCGQQRYAALTVVLQTLAANIGSSLTPFGNPQNLYLFMRYGFTLDRFVAVTGPFVLFAGALLAPVCCFVPNRPIGPRPASAAPVRRRAAAAYGILFLLAVAAVLGVVPCWICALLIVASTAALDMPTLAGVDYSLLLTFAAIFVLVGNIARIDGIYRLISGWVQRDALLTAVVTSQFISNVPAAVMLSGFTQDAVGLLVGTNVGGIGTPISSMASVISYKLCAAADPKGTWRYLKIFLALNALFLLSALLFLALLPG